MIKENSGRGRLERGDGLFAIRNARRLLGHANIATSQRYMHLGDRELADAQDLVE